MAAEFKRQVNRKRPNERARVARQIGLDLPPRPSRKRQKSYTRLDQLTMLAVGCLVVAAALIILPSESTQYRQGFERVCDFFNPSDCQFQPRTYTDTNVRVFSADRLPAAAIFAVASMFLLLLRRR